MANTNSGTSIDDINHPKTLVLDIAMLWMNDEHSDITFIVHGEHIPAHRIIVASRNQYFRALLYGGLDESKKSEINLDVPLNAFKCIMKYMYSGSLSLTEMQHEDILDILGLAHQYGFNDLQESIQKYLCNTFSVENVCATLDAALLLQLKYLSEKCYTFMDLKLKSIPQQTFRSISYEGFRNLLKRDTFYAKEVDIFNAVYDWCQFNDVTAEKAEELYKEVRFTLMSQKDLLNVVRGTNVLEPNRLLDIMADKEKLNEFPYRATPCPSELDVSTSMIKWSNKTCVVNLGQRYIINCITLKFTYSDYSDEYYVVKVSSDNEHWTKSVHCGKSTDRNMVKHFREMPIQYIKIHAESREDYRFNSLKVKRLICECSSFAQLK